jgi:sugar phosphate isomerase/epimerase
MGKKFHDVMAYLLEETEKLNFLFCMENAPYKPEHNERFPNVAEVAAFSRSFGKDRMFMTFDLNHANLNEDPVAVCADCAGLVKHIHISDNHGFREEHLVPGSGIMDLLSIMTALYQHGYSGPWNLEFAFPEKTEPTLEQYQQVYLYMKNLIAQIPARCS